MATLADGRPEQRAAVGILERSDRPVTLGVVPDSVVVTSRWDSRILSFRLGQIGRREFIEPR